MNLPVFEMLIDTKYPFRWSVVGLLMMWNRVLVYGSNFGFHYKGGNRVSYENDGLFSGFCILVPIP